MTPQITVIITAYKRADSLRLAIQSVKAQTYAAYEIIVVDDGSPGDSVFSAIPCDVRYIRQMNAGVSAARNTGILAAQTEWVAFLDDDDEYLPDRLERAVARIRESSSGIFLCNAIIETHGQPDANLFESRGFGCCDGFSECQRPLAAVLHGMFFTQGLVIRRSLLIEVGLFNHTMYEDLDLFVRLSGDSPWIIDGKPGFRLIRRDGPYNLSDGFRSKRVARAEALVRICARALAMADTRAEIRQANTKLATYLYELGEATGKRAHFWSSAQLFPALHSRIRSALAAIFPSLAKHLRIPQRGLIR